MTREKCMPAKNASRRGLLLMLAVYSNPQWHGRAGSG
jgi:hypothetical protein